jgi:toxin ParE1/3/4
VTVEWTRRAKADLAGIFSYEADDVETVPSIVDHLYAAAQGLEQFSERGRKGRLIGTRELIISPYVITYRIQRNRVRILHIEHGARRR